MDHRTYYSWLHSCWLFIQFYSTFQLRLYCRISQTEGIRTVWKNKTKEDEEEGKGNCQPVWNGPSCTVDRVILVARGPATADWARDSLADMSCFFIKCSPRLQSIMELSPCCGSYKLRWWWHEWIFSLIFLLFPRVVRFSPISFHQVVMLVKFSPISFHQIWVSNLCCKLL
jgi:hypothetical protein